MTGSQPTIEIHQSLPASIGIIAGGLAFSALCLALVTGLGPVIAPGSLKAAVLWLGTVFFAACAAVGGYRLLITRGPVVTISEEGIRDIRIADRLIPWSAVRAMSTWTSHGQRILVLDVPAEIEAMQELTRLTRLTRRANAGLGADGLCISTTGLKMSHAELVERASHFWRTSSATRPSEPIPLPRN